MIKASAIIFAVFALAVAIPARGEDLRFAPQVARPATFTFKAQAEIAGDRVLLKDVATCAGLDVVCAEAAGVDLGQAPPPGKTVHLTREHLVDLLTHEWDATAIEVVAPTGLKIAAAAIEVATDEIESELRRVLLQAFPDESPKSATAAAAKFRVELGKVQVTGKHRLRPGEHRIEFPALSGIGARHEDWLLKNVHGAQRLEVRYVPVDAPEAFEAYQVTATFVVKKNVPVAAQSMNAGAIVRDEDLDTAWVEIGRGGQKICADRAEAVGRRLKRPAPIGAPLTPAQLEIPMIVHRGQTLKLTMTSGGLTVTGHVKSMGEGSYGQVIEAFYPTTKKRLKVRIVDASTVEYLE